MIQSNENFANYDNISTKYDEYFLQDENGLDYLTTLLSRSMVSDNYGKAVELEKDCRHLSQTR